MKTDWFGKLKNWSNTFLGSDFQDDTTEAEVDNWFGENENLNLQSKVDEEVEKKTDARFDNFVIEMKKLEDAVLSNTNSVNSLEEKYGNFKEIVEKVNGFELALSEKGEENEVLEGVVTEKIKSLEESYNAKLELANKELETAKADVKAANERADKLAKEINELKGKSSGNLEEVETDATTLSGKAKQKTENSKKSATNFLGDFLEGKITTN